MPEMKILIIVKNFHPLVGGPERQSQLMARSIIKSGHKAMIVTSKKKKEWPDYEKIEDIPVHRMRPSGRYGYYISFISLIFFLVKHRNNYEIAHLYGAGIFELMGLLISKLQKKKVVLMLPLIGDIDRKELEGAQIPWIIRFFKKILGYCFIYNYLVRKADIFICLNRTIENEIKKGGIKKEKLRIIGNELDLNRFCPLDQKKKNELRSKLSLPNKFLILFVGRLVRVKGLDLLLDTWSEIVRKYPQVHLVMIGSGEGNIDSCEQDIKIKVQNNRLNDSVSFLGEKSNVEEYYKAADIFVLPSRREGSPNVLWEAMACGLPCISTNIAGISEMIRNWQNGVLVEPNSSIVLRDAILTLINDPALRKNISSKAREYVELFCASDNCTNKTLNLYSELLGNK